MAIITEDSEHKILDFLQEIEESYGNYYAIYFHLSKLLDRNRTEFQIKIGLNVISDFFNRNNGSIFLLKNYDLIVLVENANKEIIEKIIYQLRFLFIDDPLAFKKPNIENPEFSNVYVLAFQWNELVKLCKTFIESQQQDIYKNYNQTHVKSENSAIDRLVTSYNFSKIENDIQDVDLTHLIRRQNINVLLNGKNIKPIFSEIYVNIPHLKDHLEYETDFLDNKLLQRYFMERVDNKLLDVIKSDIPRYIQGSSNLNLNIETILSEDFLEFHKMVKSLGNISMVIDINLADIFLDLASFNYANGFLKELGYKTCLDGIDDYSFINIDRRSLDFDLIKLTWNSDNENQIDLLTMKDFVQKCNPNRIILTNCDEQEAIHYGHNLGLFLFQGWFLEKLYQNELSVKHNII